MPINSFLYPAPSTPTFAYNVANSCRFNVGSNDFLSRTIGTPTDEDKWTFSVWLKVTSDAPSNLYAILSSGNYPSAYETIHINGADQLFYHYNDGGGVNHGAVKYSGIIRDPSAWYNLIVSRNGTAVKIYVNGNDVTTAVTSYNNSTNVINKSGGTLRVGHSERERTGQSWNGYMSEVVLCDGQLLDETSFGEFDSDSGIWKPIDVSGLTFGNNGFYLDFEDSSALGNDVSGNNNDFTVNNLTAVDQSTDTCTNNFATLNPLYKQDHAFSDGNLTYTSSASDWDSAPSTFGASSGKWYVEAKVTALGGGVTRTTLGICDERDANEVAESEFGLANYSNGDTVGYYGASANQVYKNGSQQSGTWSTFTTNDIIGMYVDLDNGKVYFSKNGTMQNSGDPTSGSTGTGAISITTGATYLFGVTGYGGGASQINFGSPPFSISSSNSDPNGYGNFEYGTQNYYALNTKNLAEYG